MRSLAERTRPAYFVSSAADYNNIGDAVIRRHVIDWCRRHAQLYVYVGSGGKDWIEALALPKDAVLYGSRARFRWVLRLLASRRPKALVFDPGEIRLGSRNRVMEGLLLGLVALARLSGARVIHPARGVKGEDPLSLLFHRCNVLLSSVVSWRNQYSRDLIGIGDVCPDVAMHAEARPPDRTEEGLYMVVSLRGDRDFPEAAWFNSIERFARDQALEIVVACQVRSDEQRCHELAQRLSCRTLSFAGRSLLEQERFLRDLYRRSRLVISDRLHVLVLAAAGGAVPAELVRDPDPKIQTHFDVVGLSNVSMPFDESRCREATDWLTRRLAESVSVRHALDAARSEVGALADRVAVATTT